MADAPTEPAVAHVLHALFKVEQMPQRRLGGLQSLRVEAPEDFVGQEQFGLSWRIDYPTLSIDWPLQIKTPPSPPEKK